MGGQAGEGGLSITNVLTIIISGHGRQEVGGIIATCHIFRGTGRTASHPNSLKRIICRDFFLTSFHHKFTCLNVVRIIFISVSHCKYFSACLRGEKFGDGFEA